jgi:hypothetical protein
MPTYNASLVSVGPAMRAHRYQVPAGTLTCTSALRTGFMVLVPLVGLRYCPPKAVASAPTVIGATRLKDSASMARRVGGVNVGTSAASAVR